MLAPDYDTLLDFEGQMALACANVFTQASLQSGVPLPIQSSERIETPAYAFHFASGGVADQHQQMVYGFKLYDHYRGLLDVLIYTTRSENTSSSLGLYRSRVRQIFLTWRGRFASQDINGNPLCPYYQILDIWERGISPTVSQDEDQDVAAVHFEMKFNINPDAWPQPINQQTLIQTQNV